MSPRHVVVMLVVLAGCYRSQRADCTLQCGPGNACPSGEQCNNGWCMANADASCGQASDGSDSSAGDVAELGQVIDAVPDSAGTDAVTDSSDAYSDGADDAPAADGGCGDGGCRFNVGDLPGLVLWLKPGGAMLDGTGHIARWTDSSGYGHDAVQDNPTNRPSAGWESTHGEVDAGPVQAAIVRFDAVGMWLQVADDNSMHWGTNDVLFAGVIEDDSTAVGPGVVFRKQDSNDSPLFPGFSVWMNRTSNLGTTSSSIYGVIDSQYFLPSLGAYNDDRFHIVVFYRTGRRMVLRIDGYEQITADALPSDYDLSESEPAFIGAHGNGPGDYPQFQQAQGSIAEIIIVTGPATVNDTVVSELEHDLALRHGLSLP